MIGFAVVRSDIKEDAQTRLKISRHPTAQMAAKAILQRPPGTEDDARKVFEYLADILGVSVSILSLVPNVFVDWAKGDRIDLNNSDWTPLSNSPIIPTRTSSGITMVWPSKCYFKKDDGRTKFHSKLFTFVDFGVRANEFLSACGVRNAPTTDEVAKKLVDDPDGFFRLAGGADG